MLGDRVASAVPIRIASRSNLLSCRRNEAPLAQAVPAQYGSGFSGQPVAEIFYLIALANTVAGRRIAPDTNLLLCKIT